MASDRKHKQSNSIPIRFFDGDDPRANEDVSELEERVGTEADLEPDPADPKVSDFLTRHEVKYLVKPFPVQGLINCVKELLA